MRTTPALDRHAKQVKKYLDKAAEMKKQSRDFRLKAGHLLLEERRRVKAGESGVTWSAWCDRNFKLSDRGIRRLMAEARASLLQAYAEGAGAFVRGIPEDFCPYTDRRRAAWRTGWSDIQIRTRINQPAVLRPDAVG